jgi:hypothetical protein
LARVIVITSGKGGVGKTTTAAAFAAGLAREGNKTVVIDFDVGLRNLDLIMGCERRVVFDFIDVINGTARLNQALIRDKRIDGLYVLPTSQTRDKDALKMEGVEQVMEELRRDFDYVVRLAARRAAMAARLHGRALRASGRSGRPHHLAEHQHRGPHPPDRRYRSALARADGAARPPAGIAALAPGPPR